jgi:hypothetical protein
MNAATRVLAKRATAPTTDGAALARHERNPWYPARIVQTFGDGTHEIEWTDTGTRTFAREDEIRRA